MKRSLRVQFIFSILLLVSTEIAYGSFPVTGFDPPFTPEHNFGACVDLLIYGELSEENWVSFNTFPTAAHTILVCFGRKATAEQSIFRPEIQISYYWQCDWAGRRLCS